MTRRRPLPEHLGPSFSIAQAKEAGLPRNRLRTADLAVPFRGVRTILPPVADTDPVSESDVSPYALQTELRIAHARAYAPRMHPEHFFSRETAASIWGGPLPLALREDPTREGETVLDLDLPVHVSGFHGTALPRMVGVTRHRASIRTTTVTEHGGLRLSSPASTWASLGQLALYDLVALGDYFCRRWRQGYNRKDAGKAPLATVAQLRAATEAGRRVGAARLRTALELIREDSWSPRESRVRCIIIDAGLPEPVLNIDVYDDDDRFLGCVDLAYPELKVAVEYYGLQHHATYAADVERVARLRAAGWIVIEMTASLLRRPDDVVDRVAAALRERSGRS